MTDLLADIATTADELTNPRRHTELITGWDHNRNRKRVRRTINLPSLLDELAEAVTPGESYIDEDTAQAPAFGSRPPARMDAVDRYHAIERAVDAWCCALAIPPRLNLTATIRALVGAAPTMDSSTQRYLVADLTAWRTWAQTVTGWIRPPDAPRVPCPWCEARNSLRVRLDRETACCLECGAAWDAVSIRLLGRHVDVHLNQSKTAARTVAVQAARDEAIRRLVTTTPLNAEQAEACLNALHDRPLRDALSITAAAVGVALDHDADPVQLVLKLAGEVAA